MTDTSSNVLFLVMVKIGCTGVVKTAQFGVLSSVLSPFNFSHSKDRRFFGAFHDWTDPDPQIEKIATVTTLTPTTVQKTMRHWSIVDWKLFDDFNIASKNWILIVWVTKRRYFVVHSYIRYDYARENWEYECDNCANSIDIREESTGIVGRQIQSIYSHTHYMVSTKSGRQHCHHNENKAIACCIWSNKEECRWKQSSFNLKFKI